MANKTKSRTTKAEPSKAQAQTKGKAQAQTKGKAQAQTKAETKAQAQAKGKAQTKGQAQAQTKVKPAKPGDKVPHSKAEHKHSTGLTGKALLADIKEAHEAGDYY